MVRGVSALGIEVCCTLGMLNKEQARRLKEAGLSAYNHNLDTAPELYGDIITTRDSFTQGMINVLTEGATNLTAADTNEEGANMLMLQVRQSLGTTALSLSAQAAQSVLRLF